VSRRLARWGTDCDRTAAAVAKVIARRRRGRIAEAAGVADRSGGGPICQGTLRIEDAAEHPCLGDEAITGAMPKSAFGANTRPRAVRGGGGSCGPVVSPPHQLINA